MSVKQRAIDAYLTRAISQIGQGEIGGNNRGPAPKRYLASAHVRVPAPWCAAFVVDCFENSGEYGRVVRELWQPQNLAYCPSIHAWARAMGILHSKPQKGDVFLYVEDGWALHTGFVRDVAVGGRTFLTVEGNTNVAGSFDGDVVASKERTVSDAYVFVRIADLIKEPKADVADAPWLLIDKSGKPVATMLARAGRSWIKLRDWESVTGLSVEWSATAQVPKVAGRLWTRPFEIRAGNLAWAMVHDLLSDAGLAYRVDLSARSVVLL
jgi:hypothetical protein